MILVEPEYKLTPASKMYGGWAEDVQILQQYNLTA